MKRIIFLLLVTICSSLSAQQSKLIVNNYTPFDYQGVIIATGLAGCYPSVSNTYYPEPPYHPLKIGPGMTSNVGLFSSGIEVLNWDVQSASTNPVNVRYFTHPAVDSLGIIAQSTEWQHSKFSMYYAGTSTSVPNTTVNISSGTNVCYTWPSYYSNTTNTLEAEWFSIGGYTYLQIYY